MQDIALRTVAELVRIELERLTATERKVARALLANYPVAGLETVAQFAARAQVSGPTILRFVNKLGFASYVDFQRVLREELEARLQTPLEKMPEHVPGAQTDLPGRFAGAAAANIGRTFAALSRDELRAVVALLADRRRDVYLLGGRFSDAMARYLHAHLHVLRPRVHHVSGPPATWPETLLSLGRRDVVLVFDIRRYAPDLQRFAEAAAAAGATVVLFTDQWLSPIARVARHVFAVHVEVPTNWDSAVAMLAVGEALVAELTDQDWPAVKQRIEAVERLRPVASD